MSPWNNISSHSPKGNDPVLASRISSPLVTMADVVSLAYAELYLGLGMFLREFDFRVITGDEEMALIDVFLTFFNTRRVELELLRRNNTTSLLPAK